MSKNNLECGLLSQASFAYYPLTASHLHAKPAPPNTIPSNVPSDPDAVVMRYLEKNPAHGFLNLMVSYREPEQCACASQWTTEDAVAWWKLRKAPARS